MKKLIIVCEEKLRRYGEFLAQLISSNDDKEQQIVGIKDGAAAAQVWTEKEYNANAVQISSEQYILFIGNSKMMKDKRHHMQSKFGQYGMNYQWLGKQAAMFVDQALSFDEYDGFYEIVKRKYAEGSKLEAVRLLAGKEEPQYDAADLVEAQVEVEDAEIIEVTEQDEQKKGKKLLVPFAAVRDVIKKTADTGKQTLNKVSNDINAVVKGRDLEEQQYTCLALLFYLDGLAEFLEIREAK